MLGKLGLGRININVRKLRILCGAVPVFFTGGDQHHVTCCDDAFFLFSRHDAFSRSNDQDLFIIVSVKFIADAFPEVDDVNVILFAFRQKGLLDLKIKFGFCGFSGRTENTGKGL